MPLRRTYYEEEKEAKSSDGDERAYNDNVTRRERPETTPIQLSETAITSTVLHLPAM
jgi:hypothetical protein